MLAGTPIGKPCGVLATLPNATIKSPEGLMGPPLNPFPPLCPPNPFFPLLKAIDAIWAVCKTMGGLRRPMHMRAHKNGVEGFGWYKWGCKSGTEGCGAIANMRVQTNNKCKTTPKTPGAFLHGFTGKGMAFLAFALFFHLLR